MEIYSVEGLSSVIVKKEDQQITFDVKYLTASKNLDNINGRTDPFLEFNQYVNSQPIIWQNCLFEYLIEMRQALDDIFEISHLFQELNRILINVYELFDFNVMVDWIVNKSGVVIPSDLKTNMDALEDKSKVTENRTYFRKDYIDLITYSLLLRPAAFILGEFIVRSDKEIGTAFKEYEAYRLLYRTRIFENPAVDRLRIYINETIDKEKQSKDRTLDAAVISSISKDDFPDFMMGSIITKKVSLGDISGRNPKLNLIKVIFKTENQKLSQIEKTFMAGKLYVKPTPKDKATVNENNSPSVLESYRARQSISDDVPVIISFYLENPRKVLHAIDPNVPVDLLNQMLIATSTLTGNDLKDAQYNLGRMMINKVISGQAVPYLNLNDIKIILAISGALLWWYGFQELALVATGKPLVETEETILISSEKRERLKAETIEELKRRYPYSSNSRNKYQVNNMSIISSIDALEEKLSMHNWVSTLPKALTDSSNIVLQQGCYGIQKNIRHRIAELFLLLAEVVSDSSTSN